MQLYQIWKNFNNNPDELYIIENKFSNNNKLQRAKLKILRILHGFPDSFRQIILT